MLVQQSPILLIRYRKSKNNFAHFFWVNEYVVHQTSPIHAAKEYDEKNIKGELSHNLVLIFIIHLMFVFSLLLCDTVDVDDDVNSCTHTKIKENVTTYSTLSVRIQQQHNIMYNWYRLNVCNWAHLHSTHSTQGSSSFHIYPYGMTLLSRHQCSVPLTI